ncbi:type II toxin-antitoxin system prevent-host-death family antitoxin [Frankia sp. Cas3]|uniref:type II toxin-antitoxin system Phd/YefM family antitoxin n=1 Tax=Frankia sp. Cas3 TaxID=3073926 RepID=UPI002AD50211|nr:type II toxin-antitoxin system prevent-host-death family antitoxin [Frankia sp. Cas3]
MSDMTAGQASINARDLSHRAASVLDRVEHGERLMVTRDGEPIAEIIPIARTQRLLARWVRDGLIPAPPPAGYATAVASAARDLPSVPAGRTATDVLLDMREDER